MILQQHFSRLRNSVSGRLVATAVATLVLLSACAVGNNHLKPAPSLPSAWSAALPAMAAAGANTLDLVQWWRQFDDPLLTALIERALSDNRDVLEAIARVKEARALQGLADSRAQPQVDFNGGAARDRISEVNRFPMQGVKNPINLYQADIDASWEVDLFGAVRWSREAAAADTRRIEFDREAVAVSVSAEVAAAYLRLRSTQAQLATLVEQIALAREVLVIVASRVRAGLVSDYDLTRARELLAMLEARRPLLDAAAGIEMRRIGVIVGAQAGSLLGELAPGRPLPMAVPVLPALVPADLLARRADLRAIERALAATGDRVSVADAERYPRLSLSLTLGLLSLDAGNLTSAARSAWNAGFSLSAPLLDGGALDAKLAAARARYEQAAIQYESAAARAVEEVESAAQRYSGSRQRREKLAEALRANEDARNLSRVRFDGGLADFLVVLDAQRQLYQVQDDEIAAREQALINLVALYKALGGGWNAAKHTVAPQ